MPEKIGKRACGDKKMFIQPIAYNWDNYRNYAYFVETDDFTLLVDAGNFQEIEQALEKLGDKSPDYILLTHSHGDHTNGAAHLKEKYQSKVIASSYWDLPMADYNEQKAAELGFSFLHLPGHTEESGLWLMDYKTQPYAIFAGDVLFSCGCGRQFQGTDERLLTALKTVNRLSGDYLLYTGHEYTLTNVEFCLEHFSDDAPLQNYFQEVQSMSMVGEPTVPIQLSKEKQVNPFLRYNDDKLWKAIGATSPIDFVVKLRNLRDAY